MKFFGEEKWDIDRIWRFSLGAVVIISLYFILSALRSVLLPFAIAFALAYVLHPLVMFLQKHHWNKFIAVMIVLFAFFMLLGLLLSLVVPRIINEMSNISTRFTTYVTNTYDFIVSRIETNGEKEQHEIIDQIVDELKKIDVSSYFQSTVFGIFAGVISLAYYLAAMAIIPIALFFFLSDFQRISERWEMYIPKQIRKHGVPFAREVNSIISAFFRGQFLIVIVLSLLFSLGFTIVGVPLAIVMGFTIGFLNLIPYFGTLVGLVPLALLTLGKSLELDENPLYRLTGVAIVMLTVQVIQDWFLTPAIMKNRVGLRPITILMSALIWGRLLGFMGLLLAIPLSAIIKVYFQKYFLVPGEIEKQENGTGTISNTGLSPPAET